MCQYCSKQLVSVSPETWEVAQTPGVCEVHTSVDVLIFARYLEVLELHSWRELVAGAVVADEEEDGAGQPGHSQHLQ